MHSCSQSDPRAAWLVPLLCAEHRLFPPAKKHDDGDDDDDAFDTVPPLQSQFMSWLLHGPHPTVITRIIGTLHEIKQIIYLTATLIGTTDHTFPQYDV